MVRELARPRVLVHLSAVRGLLRANVAPYFTAHGVIAASFVAPFGALIGLALGHWRPRLLFGAMFVSLVLMVGMHGAGAVHRSASCSHSHSSIRISREGSGRPTRRARA